MISERLHHVRIFHGCSMRCTVCSLHRASTTSTIVAVDIHSLHHPSHTSCTSRHPTTRHARNVSCLASTIRSEGSLMHRLISRCFERHVPPHPKITPIWQIAHLESPASHKFRFGWPPPREARRPDLACLPHSHRWRAGYLIEQIFGYAPRAAEGELSPAPALLLLPPLTQWPHTARRFLVFLASSWNTATSIALAGHQHGCQRASGTAKRRAAARRSGVRAARRG